MESARKILLSLFVFFWCSGAPAQPALDMEEVPPYDYSQTELIVFYGEKGHVFLGPPLEHPAPSMGALVYEMILLYVPQFQDIIIPPAAPTHVMDLLMKDRFGKQHIGQRLYLGDAWLSDGKRIAFMKSEDYTRLVNLLHQRYSATTPSDTAGLEHFRRPMQDELPDNWLPGPASVTAALERMPPSDYEYHGYDPGAAIRRRGSRNNERSLSAGTVAQVAARANPVTVSEGTARVKPAQQQPPGPSAPEELEDTERQEFQPPAETPQCDSLQSSTPQDRVPHNDDNDERPSEEEPAMGEENRRRVLLLSATLVIFLLVRLLNRKRPRNGSGEGHRN